MMKLYWTFVLVVHLLPGRAAGQINKPLQAELDSIYRVDQRYRAIMASPQQKDSLATAHHLTGQAVDQLIRDQLMKADRSNLGRVEQLIKQHGYPGTRLVGSPTNEAAWHVIQHSDAIAVYFPLIQQAGEAGQLPFHLVAMMQDRLLMSQGKEQLYGTQIWCEKGECYVWPIANAAQVNQRRARAGFTTTVEQNAQRFGVTYKERSLPKR